MDRESREWQQRLQSSTFKNINFVFYWTRASVSRAEGFTIMDKWNELCCKDQ